MSQNSLVTVEILDAELLSLTETSDSSHNDRVSVELVSRKRETLLKCPVCQGLLDAHVPSVECLVDETKYCRNCAAELARENERCWMCGLFTFSNMLEASS